MPRDKEYDEYPALSGGEPVIPVKSGQKYEVALREARRHAAKLRYWSRELNAADLPKRGDSRDYTDEDLDLILRFHGEFHLLYLSVRRAVNSLTKACERIDEARSL